MPLRRAGLVDAGSLRVDGHRYRHIAHVELVNGFHSQVSEGHDARAANGL